MGVRPNLYVLIGVDVNNVQKGEEWVQDFQRKHDEDDFLSIVKPALLSCELDPSIASDVMDTIKDRTFNQMFHVLKREGQCIAGVLPIIQSDESQLYDHDLVYALLEAGILKDEVTTISLPFKDYELYIGKTKEEMKDSKLTLHEKRELLQYSGKWGRKYTYHSLDWLDEELELAYTFFVQSGLTIQRKDIQRYVVFEWN